MKSQNKFFRKAGAITVLMSSYLLFTNNVAIAANDIQTTFASDQIYWSLPSGYSSAQASVNGVSIDSEDLTFSILDKNDEVRADGYYSYNISANPDDMVDDIAAMKAAREANDSKAYSQLSNKLQQGSAYETVSASGAFEIINGLIEEYDLEAKELASQQARTFAAVENQGEEESND